MPLPGALSNLIHPSLMAALDDYFYPAAVTIQANTPTNTGGVLTDSWANVAGLVDLDCRIAPAGATERRRAEPYLRMAGETHTVVIDDYYTTITAAMRAVVTTVGGESLTLNILAVEHDSQNITTRLKAEKVTH